MTRYLISFDDGAMAHIPAGELPAVGDAARAVMRAAKSAGVWVHGGGVMQQRACIVGTDGVVAEGPWPETKTVVGGFCIVQVSTREDALAWAAKFAAACRCAQEVRQLGDDPENWGTIPRPEAWSNDAAVCARRRPSTPDVTRVAAGDASRPARLLGLCRVCT